jgi:NSS family neurotransmitter:Na+ symporter
LVFQSLPVAFSQMAGGRLISSVFFALLLFAALTSAISLLEVVTSTFIDLLGWPRRVATLATGSAIFVLGLPSALHQGPLFGTAFEQRLGRNFFDLVDHISSNWMLPLGGLLIALYVGWAIGPDVRSDEFRRATPGAFLSPWLATLKLVAPAAVLMVLANSTGLLDWLAALGLLR